MRNIGPALDSIAELRLFSVPLSFPALGLIGNVVPATLITRPSNQPFEIGLDRALLERRTRMGVPSLTWRSVWLLEPAHAPHRLWLDTPLTPEPQRAAELIADTGLFQDGFLLSDADSDAEMAASAMFLVTRPEDGFDTYTVSNPVTPLGYHLMHMTPGVTVSLAELPIRPGMRYRPPTNIVPGAHFALQHAFGVGPAHVTFPASQPPAEAVPVEVVEELEATDVEVVGATTAAVEVPSSPSDAPASPRLSRGTSLVHIRDPGRQQRARALSQACGPSKHKCAVDRSIATPLGVAGCLYVPRAATPWFQGPSQALPARVLVRCLPRHRMGELKPL